MSIESRMKKIKKSDPDIVKALGIISSFVEDGEERNKKMQEQLESGKPKKDFDEALDCLYDVVLQTCWDGKDELDSGALSAFANAMRLLAVHGRIKIKTAYGRRIIATLPKDR